ncbi:hypothetical protein AAG906_013709 [Vitis piasezkii]
MAESRVKEEALQIIGLCQVLPRLVVFDLDYTLWPFYCECRSKREMPSLYPHAEGILYALKEKGIDMAIASRSPTPDIAKTFLDKLGIKSMFVAQEIFSSWSHKTEHFQRIHRRTGVPFNSMLFSMMRIGILNRFQNRSNKHFGRQWVKYWSIKARAREILPELSFIWKHQTELNAIFEKIVVPRWNSYMWLLMAYTYYMVLKFQLHSKII